MGVTRWTARRTARLMGLGLWLVTASLTVEAVAPAHAAAAVIARRVKGGLKGPAGFTFLSSGKILYLERSTGRVRILNLQTKRAHTFFRIPGVNGDGERGALGVAVHPRWPDRRSVYVYVTRRDHGRLRNEIVRIRGRHGRGVGFTVLMTARASSSPYHNGGRIAFGPDGNLYAIVGDGHDSANAQDVTRNLLGKIVRLRADGGVPAGNPALGGRRTRVFAFGIRNSFGFTFDPQTDRLWETENGPTCNDEINLIVRRGNYAWGPHEACPNTNRDGPRPRRTPEWNFPSTIGITGTAFCAACGLGFEGDLFFGANNDGVLRRATLNGARDAIVNVVNVLSAPGGAIYSIETAPNGTIYFSDPSALYRLTVGP
jgi:aldose sugar dehydrogenase